MVSFYTYPQFIYDVPDSRASDWGKRRELVIERDGFECQNCGRGSNSEFEVHHIVPLSKGGSNKISNLTTLCQGCHDSIHHDSKTAPVSKESSSSVGPPPTEDQLNNCPECTYSYCSYGDYDERTMFCESCRTLWRYKYGDWVTVSCPNCDSEDGFTWGRDGRIGSCNQCNSELNAAKKYTGEIDKDRNWSGDENPSVFRNDS